MQFNKSSSKLNQNENGQSELINYKLRGENGQNHTELLLSPCLACFNAVWRNLITLIAFLMKYAWIILFHNDLKGG